MSGDRDEVLGKLSEELHDAMAKGEIIDAGLWAERFGVSEGDVQQCQRGLAALVTSLGEEMLDGLPELPQPELPGDFEVVDELGRGGMGVVYRARQRSLDREVAIKVLRPGDLVFGDALRRFRAEARSLARLRHRHIVSVYDSGETPEGLVWFAMDLVDGRTLADELKSRGRMLPARATKIIRQVTSAIAHAHAQGIVHRDLKPQNVLIDGNGDAFVVDFGLARDAASAGTNTMSGELLGTPTYMSPEQASGDAANIGEACDVWALGTMLYEMLVGKAPFAGKPLHETIRSILHDAPPSMRRNDKKIPPGLELVCTHALQKRPEDRYEGALAFGEDIERFQDGRGVLVEKPSKLRRISRVLKQHWRGFAIIAAAVLVTLLAVAAWLPSMRRDAIVQESQRLVAAGHPDAAIESLRAVLKDTDYSASDHSELQYAFVQAINDRAGELLGAGSPERAASVAKEALPIATRHVTSGILRTAKQQRQVQWRWQLARACAVADRARSPEVPTKLLVADLRSELPGRRLLARRTATMPGVDLSQFEATLQREILCDNLHMMPTDLAQTGADFAQAEHSWLDSVHTCWSPELEDALAAIATSDKETHAPRAIAFHLWARCVGLPTFDGLRASGTSEQSRPTAAQVVAIAATAIERWRSWRDLPREQALKSRIDLIVDAWLTPGKLLPARTSDLRIAAENWTGHAAASPKQFRSWWLSARNGSYEQLLQRALGRPEGQSASMLEALDQSAAADETRDCLWRQLAWLQVADGIRIPEAHPHTIGNSNKWRTACLRATGTTDDRLLTARMALLRFDDGGCKPTLIAQQRHDLHIGEPLRFDLRGSIVEPSWCQLRKAWEDERHRAPQWLRVSDLRVATPQPRPGEVTATVQGTLHLDRHGVRFLAQDSHRLRHRLPWTDKREHQAGVQGVWAGTAAALESERVRWDMGQRTTHIVVVVALHEASGSAAPHMKVDVDWWHDAIAQSFANTNRPTSWSASRSKSADWLTTALWPTPAALPDMLSLATEAEPPAHYTAIALAGDSEQQVNWPRLFDGNTREFGTRMALGSASKQQQQHALEELLANETEPWTPRIAQTLAAGAAAQNLELPTPLRAELDAVAPPDGIFDWLMRETMHEFLASILLWGLLVWALTEGTNNRERTRAICWGVLSSWLFFVHIRIGGVLLTPGFVAIILMTWFAMRGSSGRSAWRFVALGLMVLASASAFSAWFFHTDPDIAGPFSWVIGAFVVAFVPSSIAERRAAIRTKGLPPSLRDSRRKTARERRRAERNTLRAQMILILGVGAFLGGWHLLSSYLSGQVLSTATVRIVDPAGEPVANVLTYLQTGERSPYLTGTALPPSDESGYVDLSRVQNQTGTLGEFYMDVQLPGFDHVPCDLEGHTTIVVPHTGSLSLQLVDHNDQPWRTPATPFNGVRTKHGGRNGLWFDSEGRAEFPLITCGKVELAGRFDASGLLDGRIINGPSKPGQAKVVRIKIPESMPRLTGVLLRPDGEPVKRDVSLTLRTPTARLGHYRITPDSSGRIRFLMADDPTNVSVEVSFASAKRTIRLPSGVGPAIDLGTVQLVKD